MNTTPFKPNTNSTNTHHSILGKTIPDYTCVYLYFKFIGLTQYMKPQFQFLVFKFSGQNQQKTRFLSLKVKSLCVEGLRCPNCNLVLSTLSINWRSLCANAFSCFVFNSD